MKDTLILLIKGGVIGVANIIPGVSGGTLAVILGIYDQLIEAIAEFSSNKKKRVEYFLFLVKIFIGAALAIVLLANLMDYALTEHFYKTMFLFMGLILGGIPIVVRSHGDMKIRTTRILAFVVGMIIVLSLASMSERYGGKEIVQQIDVSSLNMKMGLILLLSGFLAGGAMIVPGVSGSFVLVLLGQYALVIASIKEMAAGPLALIAAGAFLGVLVFSKIIESALKKMPADTYYFILGLIVASLYKIFPGVPAGTANILFCIVCFVIGAGVSCGLSKVSNR